MTREGISNVEHRCSETDRFSNHLGRTFVDDSDFIDNVSRIVVAAIAPAGCGGSGSLFVI